MSAYEVVYYSGGATVVSAPDEHTARRLAMVERYGTEPFPIIPHAPEYNGRGLRVHEVSK